MTKPKPDFLHVIKEGTAGQGLSYDINKMFLFINLDFCFPQNFQGLSLNRIWAYLLLLFSGKSIQQHKNQPSQYKTQHR